MPPDCSEECCICLCGGADIPPPCGHTKRLWFHAECLKRARESAPAPFRCPHCNDVCETAHATASRNVNALLTTWPGLNEGYWVQSACFIPVADGRLLTHQEGEEALQCMRAVVRGRMRDGGEGMVETNTSVARRWLGVETVVSFERAAFVGAMGRIRRDGYIAAARRRRVNPMRKSVCG